MKTLLLVPSFYGAVAWNSWLTLYLINPVGWDAPSPESIVTFFLVGVLFILATALAHKSFKTIAIGRPVEWPLLSWILGGVGAIGIAIHVVTLTGSFNGMANLLSALSDNSAEIRWENAEVTSVGIQLSYFGWMACGIWACTATSSNHTPLLRCTAALSWTVIFLLNLLMIDRTRPFWIVITSLLMLLPHNFRKVRVRTVVWLALASSSFLISVFIGIAIWIGKIGDHLPGNSVLEAAFDNIAIYGTGGFAYFDKIRTYDTRELFSLERTLYPFFKFLSTFDLVRSPPSQILEFESIPHEVNVGTFLAPLFLDGGPLFTLIGSVVLIWGSNVLGRYMLTAHSLSVRYGWAALCFCCIMSFFSSHFVSTPLWTFLLFALMEGTFHAFKVKKPEEVT